MREIANSSQTTVSASTSPVQNPSLSETSTDGLTTHTTESTVDNASGNSHEVANASERTDEHSEDDLDSKEKVDTSEECVDGKNETRVADAEIDQGNSADVSIESIQERVRSCYM